VAKVQGMMPIARHVDQKMGQTVEDWEMVFADDERKSSPTSFKFLQMAHAWLLMWVPYSELKMTGYTSPASSKISAARYLRTAA